MSEREKSLFGDILGEFAKQFRCSKRRNNEPKMQETLWEEDLQAFARNCQERWPEAKACHIVCLRESAKRCYKVTALMLNANGKAIASKDDYVGKIFYTRTLGECVKKRLNGSDEGDFTFPLERKLTYQELLEFISDARAKYSEVCGASISCLWQEKEKKYKVTALAFNSEGKAITVDSEEKEGYLGYGWAVDSLDEAIDYRLTNKKADEFRILLNDVEG